MLALGRRFWHRTVCVSTSDVQIVEDSFVRCKKFLHCPDPAPGRWIFAAPPGRLTAKPASILGCSVKRVNAERENPCGITLEISSI